jgi:hypothetical protein
MNSLQQSASVLDGDAMQTSRLWESVFTSGPTTGDIYNRSFSSGRVALTVPSPFFENLAQRALIGTSTIDLLCSEFAKIEEYYAHQLKEGKRPVDIDEKVRAAMIHKIQELKTASSLK